MNYQVEDILKDVRVAMDMDREPSALLATDDVDTLTVNDIIREGIVDAVRCTHTEAPYHLLEQGHNLGPDLTFNGSTIHGDNASIIWDASRTGVGCVIIPDELLRLVVFQMSDWERAVYQPITPADPLYSRQTSPVEGVRGNVHNPVVALAVRPFGRVLEFYSSKTNTATITYGVYLNQPHIHEEQIDISEQCYRAFVHKAASLALIAMGELDKANIQNEIYKSLLV